MSAPASGTVRAGERLGPYELVRQIAVGGMAEIYLAKVSGISGFEKLVALKMIHPNYAEDEHFVELLVEEAKIAVHLTQPNIVQIYDLGRIGPVYYIAMEYVDGADLYHVLRTLSEAGHELDIASAVHIAREVCAGLDYAHRCRDRRGRPLGIIHRDISPQNILLSRAGEVKLADFGIAKASLRARQTAVGVIKGKYYYMSPEQAWGHPVDPRTDIFSTGIVLYECLVGQMLYLEEDMARLLERVREANIAPPSSLRPEIPPALDALVMRALARRPEDRYPTAHHFQVALEQFLWRHEPGYSTGRLRRAVEQALAIAEARQTFDLGGPGSEVATAAASAALLSREEVISLSLHSLISVEDAREVDPDAGDGLDFEDETWVSAPPVMGAPSSGLAEASGAAVGPVGRGTASAADAWDAQEEATTRVAKKRGGASQMGGPRAAASPAAPAASAAPYAGIVPPGGAPEVPVGGPWGGGPPPAAGLAGAPVAPGGGPRDPVRGPGGMMPPEDAADALEAQMSARRRRLLWGVGIAGVLILVGILLAVLLTAQKVLTEPGSVELQSIPDGAAVYYHGKRVGRTPHRLDSLDPEEVHWVRLELQGCESKRVALRVRPGETRKVVVRLENCDEGAGLR